MGRCGSSSFGSGSRTDACRTCWISARPDRRLTIGRRGPARARPPRGRLLHRPALRRGTTAGEHPGIARGTGGAAGTGQRPLGPRGCRLSLLPPELQGLRDPVAHARDRDRAEETPPDHALCMRSRASSTRGLGRGSAPMTIAGGPPRPARSSRRSSTLTTSWRWTCVYGQALASPPQVLPSGWAAVLTLYGLR